MANHKIRYRPIETPKEPAMPPAITSTKAANMRMPRIAKSIRYARRRTAGPARRYVSTTFSGVSITRSVETRTESAGAEFPGAEFPGAESLRLMSDSILHCQSGCHSPDSAGLRHFFGDGVRHGAEPVAVTADMLVE